MDPFTLAAAISAGGSLFKGLTGLFGESAAEKEAKLAARQHLEEGGLAADAALRQGDRVAATAATRAAANGGGLVGSALSVITDLSQQAMMNARTAVYRSRTQARNDIYQANVAKTQGAQDLIGGVIGAGSSIAGGFMQSAQFGQQQQALASLRGLGADSSYDYAVPY